MSAALPVVLGSSSKWRQQVLRSKGYSFTVATADIDEKAVHAGFSDRETADPSKLTLAIARAKADAILPKLSAPCLLVTSDQVVVYDGRIREKPVDASECRAFLKSYETAPAVTCCAVVVTNTQTGKVYEEVDFASQAFLPVPDDVVTQVIERGDIMYCCGGFMIDEPLLKPYLGERKGTEDSIMGMPLATIQRLLQQAQND